MQAAFIQDLKDQLTLLQQQARQSHQEWAEEPSSQPVGLQSPEPQRVGAMRFLLPRHRCSRAECTIFGANVDALKRTRRAWPPSTIDSKAGVSTEQNYAPAMLDWKRDSWRSLTQGWVFIVLGGCSPMNFIKQPLTKKQNFAPQPQQRDVNKWKIWIITDVETDVMLWHTTPTWDVLAHDG